MRKKQFRRRYIVDPEFQFWFVFVIIIIVLVEGAFISWVISHLSSIVSEWQQTHMVINFFTSLILILFVLIGVNFILGIYLSHKIVGPLVRVRKVLEGIRGGSFDCIQLRRNSMLKSFVKDFNETILMLDKLVHRDQNIVNKVSELLNKCEEMLKKKNAIKKREEIQNQLSLIRSFLTTINSHFRLSAPLFAEEEGNEKKDNIDSR